MDRIWPIKWSVLYQPDFRYTRTPAFCQQNYASSDICLLTMFETFILRCVHFILALGTFFKHVLVAFQYVGLSFQKKSVYEEIRADARHLKKLPCHFAILVLEDKESYFDIANIILWSVALGISYISVYDVNGKSHSFGWRKYLRASEWIIGCLTSQSTIFQSYMRRHTDVQADWRRKLDLRSGSKRHRHFVGFLTCPSKHRHGPSLFIRLLWHAGDTEDTFSLCSMHATEGLNPVI